MRLGEVPVTEVKTPCPLALSDVVAGLVDAGLVAATVTAGHAFGGDLEAVNVASALDVAVARLRADLEDPDEAGARRLVERLALCLAGSLLLRHGAPAVAEAFCVTRLGGDGGRSYGTLPRGVDAASIVERHRPRV